MEFKVQASSGCRRPFRILILRGSGPVLQEQHYTLRVTLSTPSLGDLCHTRLGLASWLPLGYRCSLPHVGGDSVTVELSRVRVRTPSGLAGLTGQTLPGLSSGSDYRPRLVRLSTLPSLGLPGASGLPSSPAVPVVLAVRGGTRQTLPGVKGLGRGLWSRSHDLNMCLRQSEHNHRSSLYSVRTNFRAHA